MSENRIGACFYCNAEGDSPVPKPNNATFCGLSVPVVLVLAGLLSLILGLSIGIPDAMVQVSEEEVCEVEAPYNNPSITVKTDPGHIYVGAGAQKHCLPRVVEHLSFDGGREAGIFRVITARTSEGLPVDLEIDIEFRLRAENMDEITRRAGIDNFKTRYAKVARAETRDAASLFVVEDYLRGSREAIAQLMQDRVQTRFDGDGLHADVIRVNLMHIDVYDEFEAAFQEVEDIQLDLLEASENRNLSIIEESRLNSTQLITLLAQRDRRLQEERTLVISAELAKEAAMIHELKQAFNLMIEKETQRARQTIATQARLETVVANQSLRLQELERAVVREYELAKTQRANMEIESLGRVARAKADRERDLIKARTDQVQRWAALETETIQNSLDIFKVQANANLTQVYIERNGTIHAAQTTSQHQPHSEQLVSLMDQLGLNETQLAYYVWWRTLSAVQQNVSSTLDWQKVPLLTEMGPTPASSSFVITA